MAAHQVAIALVFVLKLIRSGLTLYDLRELYPLPLFPSLATQPHLANVRETHTRPTRPALVQVELSS